MSQRLSFIARLQDGERMTDLCREYGISRKTGHKIWNRWRDHGPEGLLDQSRAAHRLRHRLPTAVEEAILALKREYPTWGAKKLRAKLSTRYPGLRVPARSTTHEVLVRHGLVKRRKRRRRTDGTGDLRPATAPNALWCADFKGQFRLGDRSLCYPLTVTDRFSRFCIGCEALDGTAVAPSRHVFEMLFDAYGLPDAIRTDNGVPFATTGLRGWSRLSAWWVKLGIRIERIEPGHPEQNGQHERFHLTLKRETTRPAAANALQQQELFDRFLEVFNQERPHEALDMVPPASLYTKSERKLPKQHELEYPLHDDTLRVSKSGHINLGGRTKNFYLSSALANEYVGIREIEHDRWLVSFANINLGVCDLRTRRFEPDQGAQ